MASLTGFLIGRACLSLPVFMKGRKGEEEGRGGNKEGETNRLYSVKADNEGAR